MFDENRRRMARWRKGFRWSLLFLALGSTSVTVLLVDTALTGQPLPLADTAPLA